MSADAARGDEQRVARTDSYMGVLNPAAAAHGPVRAPPTLPEGVQPGDAEERDAEEGGAGEGAVVIPPPPGDGAVLAADVGADPNPALPEYNKDTPLETLREEVERRKHLKAIAASGLYSDKEIASLKSMPLTLLQATAEAAEEKAKLLACLAEQANLPVATDEVTRSPLLRRCGIAPTC